MKQANKAKLQDFLNRFQKILNNDEIFIEDESTMETFLKEMKNHNTLIAEG